MVSKSSESAKINRKSDLPGCVFNVGEGVPLGGLWPVPAIEMADLRG